MAQDFLTGLATVNDGDITVTIDAGLNAGNVGSGSSLFVNGIPLPVETLSGGLGILNLKIPWSGGNIAGVPFTVTYTPITLANAIETLSTIRDDWLQSVKDVDDLVESAGSAAEDLNAMEGDIATAQTDLANIQGSLDADKNASAASASAAQQAEANVIVIYDNFDDRSLGEYPTDPLTDNDGDPLQIGASYWNTTTGKWFWDGSKWESPSITATNAATSASSSAVAASNSVTLAAAEVVKAQGEVTLAAAEVVKAQGEVTLAAAEVVLATAEKTLAQQYATNPFNTYIPNTTDNSAFHWSEVAKSYTYRSAGFIKSAGYVITGNTVSIDGTGICNYYSNNDETGILNQFTVGAAVLDLSGMVDGSRAYIIAKDVAGTPTYEVDLTMGSHGVTEAIYASVLRIDTDFIVHTELNGLHLTNKLKNRALKNRYFERSDTGMTVSNPSADQIAISSGNGFYGLDEIIYPSVNSSVEPALVYHGILGFIPITGIQNTQYMDATGNLQTLISNRYAINWVYRIVDPQVPSQILVLLGGGNHTLADAEAETAPTYTTAIISEGAELVGKIVCQESTLPPYSISKIVESGIGATDPQIATNTVAISKNKIFAFAGMVM